MDGNGHATLAILIGVWATFALDVFSTLNSSPPSSIAPGPSPVDGAIAPPCGVVNDGITPYVVEPELLPDCTV